MSTSSEEARAPRLLGVAASLRGARWGSGGTKLLESLNRIETTEELREFLKVESELHLENFLRAGREQGKSFLEIYENLGKLSGDRGLSNSEVALAAGLWSARRLGVEIDYASLAEHFTSRGKARRTGGLRKKLLACDGLLLAGPVYFGDRGSLSESLLDFIAKDPELRERMAGKLYGGITVGAKRNGGQETTLIYQLLDLLELGFLGVGNDSETTSQYGGTGVAGDVGTMHSDTYGLNTAMGTGRRLARVLHKLNTDAVLADKPRVLFLILREAGGLARSAVDHLLGEFGESVHATVLDITKHEILRCIACDICPTHIDVDEKYRCIIEAPADQLKDIHGELLHHDMIVPISAITRDRTDEVNRYQVFIERTRYLRRGDYVWTDQLVMPMVIEELGARNTYLMRTSTSFIRHHTVLAAPTVGTIHEGELLNGPELTENFGKALAQASRLAAGGLASSLDGDATTRYNPVGYLLSAHKEREDEKLLRRQGMMADRIERTNQAAATRLQR